MRCLPKQSTRYETHGPSLNLDGGVVACRCYEAPAMHASQAKLSAVREISPSPMLKFLQLFLRSYCQQCLRSLRFEASARLRET